MVKRYFYQILICFSTCILMISCGNNATSTTQEPQTQNTETTTETEGSDIKPITYRKDFPNIPVAEKGITVVNKDGWKKETYEFHLGYCAQMLANLEGYDAVKFCECFVPKIQYYYEPIYFKEAYEDQSNWNKYCLEQAQK